MFSFCAHEFKCPFGIYYVKSNMTKRCAKIRSKIAIPVGEGVFEISTWFLGGLPKTMFSARGRGLKMSKNLFIWFMNDPN